MLTMATNPLNTKQRYLPTLIKVVCSNIVPVISKTRCHQERRNRFLPAFGRKSLKEKRASLLALAEITVNLSKVDKKMNFQYGCSALICLFGTQLRPTFLKKASQFEMEKVVNLGIPHVGEKIFESIETPELIKCLDVSRTWKVLTENKGGKAK